MPVMRSFVALVCAYLLIHWSLSPVWNGFAHGAYAAFILAILRMTWASPLPANQRGVARADVYLLALWILCAVMMVLAAYSASGWIFWHRAALVLLMSLLTVRHVRAYRRAGAPVRGSNALLICASFVLALLLTVAADRALGALDGGRRQPGGLVFPRWTQVRYETPEFAYSVRINTHGWRGDDVSLAPLPACRIMLLGDSFTYGWGVEYAQTWGNLLEQQLRERYYIDAQVLNLGVPGGNTADYAAIAQRAAPLLSPHVILVGVLQGDDMRQMSRGAGTFPRSLRFGEATQSQGWQDALTFHYPFIAERTVLTFTSAGSIRRTWANTAATFITSHTPEQAARYTALDSTLRGWFERGEINPHFVQLAVTAPDYWLWVHQPAESLAPYIAQMSAHFAQVQAAAPSAHVQVISVPHGAYTQASAQADLARLGFLVPPDLLTNPLVDVAIQDASQRANVGFWAPTAHFRATQAPLFYAVDGHFNAEGNRHFAEALAPSVMSLCAVEG